MNVGMAISKLQAAGDIALVSGCELAKLPAVDALHIADVLEAIEKDWKQIKFSVIETAQNNAGEDGDESVYRILTWVANMMDNYEARWPK